jgi:hypothetical protein
MQPKDFHALVQQLIDSLQVALLLSQRLELDTQQSAKDASELRAAVARAASAAQLRPSTGEEQGGRQS